jgi:hypothetical protein
MLSWSVLRCLCGLGEARMKRSRDKFFLDLSDFSFDFRVLVSLKVQFNGLYKWTIFVFAAEELVLQKIIFCIFFGQL